MLTRPFRLIIDCSTNSIGLCGELDMSSTEGLRRILASLSARTITLDLTELTFIDSAGLACLIAASQHHDRIVLRGIRPEHERLIELANLRSAFEFEDRLPIEVRGPTGSRSVTPGHNPPAARPLTSVLSVGTMR